MSPYSDSSSRANASAGGDYADRFRVDGSHDEVFTPAASSSRSSSKPTSAVLISLIGTHNFPLLRAPC